MKTIADIRVENVSISELAKQLKLSRPTIRKHIRTTEEPVYPARQSQPYPHQAVILSGSILGWSTDAQRNACLKVCKPKAILQLFRSTALCAAMEMPASRQTA